MAQWNTTLPGCTTEEKAKDSVGHLQSQTWMFSPSWHQLLISVMGEASQDDLTGGKREQVQLAQPLSCPFMSPAHGDTCATH